MSLLSFLQDPTLYDFQSESIMGLTQLAQGFALNILALLITIILLYKSKFNHHIPAFGLVIANMTVFVIGYLTAQPLVAIGLSACILLGAAILTHQHAGNRMNQWAFVLLATLLGCINAMIGVVNIFELLIINLLLVSLSFLAYWFWIRPAYKSQTITISQLSLLKPTNKAELLLHLKRKTGLSIQEIDILHINLSNETADLRVFYHEKTLLKHLDTKEENVHRNKSVVKHENIYPKPSEEEEKMIHEMMETSKKKKIILKPDSREEVNQLLGS